MNESREVFIGFRLVWVGSKLTMLPPRMGHLIPTTFPLLLALLCRLALLLSSSPVLLQAVLEALQALKLQTLARCALNCAAKLWDERRIVSHLLCHIYLEAFRMIPEAR